MRGNLAGGGESGGGAERITGTIDVVAVGMDGCSGGLVLEDMGWG